MARVALIIATVFLFIWFAETLLVEFLFTLLAGAFLITLQVFLLTRYVLGITRVIEQFIDAIGKEETPELQFGTGKALFRKLKEQSNSIKQAMNARRLEKEKDDRILIHVINSADPGLFCFNSKGEVLFVNESASGLVYNSDLFHMDDIKDLNEKLWVAFNELKPGSPRVIRLYQEQSREDAIRSEQLLSIRLKEIKIFDESYRLFSLQNIQEELHKNESDSWQKLIRVLTHEIMNAVSPMLSLSKSLQLRVKPENGKEAEKIVDGLRMIETTGKGLVEFIEEYRRLSLLPLPKRKELRLKEALGGILLLLENEAKERNIRLSMEMDEPVTEIFADPQQFEMILLNLLRNSFDSFSDAHQDKQVMIRTQRSGKRVLVKVEDNGTGIAKELIDQVFVPFFSTKEQGSGIGLSLVRQVMNQHEGSIHLESIPGERTTVTLLF
jgi:nitrogen fixation/metabolism regulation signal transduction histidine kinase